MKPNASSTTFKTSRTVPRRKTSLSSVHNLKEVHPSKQKNCPSKGKAKHSKQSNTLSSKVEKRTLETTNKEMREKIKTISVSSKQNKENIKSLIKELTLNKLRNLDEGQGFDCDGDCNRRLEQELARVRKRKWELESEALAAAKWKQEKEQQFHHIRKMLMGMNRGN